MLQRVDNFIKENRLLAVGERLVVAVSGGPDSVCLLHLLHRLSSHWGWSLRLAHLEHGLRGTTSRGDAAFVQRLAEQLGWPLVLESCPIPAILAEWGGSVQDVCRQERHAFLQRIAKEADAAAILVAHHSGDQAETVLLHLIRGAGLGGLAGMAAREHGLGETPYVRPLLHESKKAIFAYLRQQQLGWRVDASNSHTDYARNQVRLELMPLLAAINPEAEAALGRTATLLQAEEQYLTQQAQLAWEACRQQAQSLIVSRLAAYPLALRRRLVRLLWQELSGGLQDLRFSHVESALALLEQAVGSIISWPLGWQVRRGYDKLIWEKEQVIAKASLLTLPIPGSLTLPQGQIIASLAQPEEFSSRIPDPWVAYLDLDSLGDSQLAVRQRRPGDYFYPLGMGGRKKLQDFFVDNKVDQRERERIPLVVSGEEIVWVVGQRLDNRWRVTDTSTRLLRLEYRTE